MTREAKDLVTRADAGLREAIALCDPVALRHATREVLEARAEARRAGA